MLRSLQQTYSDKSVKRNFSTLSVYPGSISVLSPPCIPLPQTPFYYFQRVTKFMISLLKLVNSLTPLPQYLPFILRIFDQQVITGNLTPILPSSKVFSPRWVRLQLLSIRPLHLLTSSYILFVFVFVRPFMLTVRVTVPFLNPSLPRHGFPSGTG